MNLWQKAPWQKAQVFSGVGCFAHWSTLVLHVEMLLMSSGVYAMEMTTLCI